MWPGYTIKALIMIDKLKLVYLAINSNVAKFKPLNIIVHQYSYTIFCQRGEM